jgi:hypothetical protein
MTYYIELKNGTYLPIGEKSFKNFWADQGYDLLLDIVFKKPHLIDTIKIKDEKSTEYTVQYFVDSLVNLNVIHNK